MSSTLTHPLATVNHHNVIPLLASYQIWRTQLESYFWQRKADLDLVIYSTIKLADQDLAQELFFRISEGEQTFIEAAKN